MFYIQNFISDHQALQGRVHSFRLTTSIFLVLLVIYPERMVAQVESPTQADSFTVSTGSVNPTPSETGRFSTPRPRRYRRGEMIVKFRSTASRERRSKFAQKMAQPGYHLKRKARFTKLQHLKIDQAQDFDTTLAELRADPEVEFAEPNYIIQLEPVTSSDSGSMNSNSTVAAFSTAEEALVAMGRTFPFGVAGTYSQSQNSFGLTEAWNHMAATSSDVPVVAVMDTGVDYNHSVFVDSGAIWENSDEVAGNGVDDDGNGYVDDVRGWNFYSNSNDPMDDDRHGTHVAGVILGATMDILQPTVPPAKIKIMPLKFLGPNGAGDTMGAINAIEYAMAKGVRVINASWGGPSYSKSLHEALARAYAAGILVITAAGNNGSDNNKNPIYPANLTVPSLLSVAAVKDNDQLALFSDYGRTSVHLAAPGVNILSTLPNGHFGQMSGTSMAAPLVAGLGALAFREAPQLSGYQVRQLLLDSVDPISDLAPKVLTGGRINALNVITQAQSLTNEPAYSPGYTVIVPIRALASTSSSHSSSGGGCGSLAVMKSMNNKAFGDSEKRWLDEAWNSQGPSDSQGAPAIVVILFLLPLIFLMLMRRKALQISEKSFIQAFEKRFKERMNVNDHVVVRSPQGEFITRLLNFSRGGLCFQNSDRHFEVDESLTFIFTDLEALAPIEISARVVWSKDNLHSGVRFDALNDLIRRFFLRVYQL